MSRYEKTRKRTHRDILVSPLRSASCRTRSWCIDRFSLLTPKTSTNTLAKNVTRVALSSHHGASQEMASDIYRCGRVPEHDKKYLSRLVGRGIFLYYLSSFANMSPSRENFFPPTQTPGALKSSSPSKNPLFSRVSPSAMRSLSFRITPIRSITS